MIDSMANAGLHISVKADEVFNVFGFPVTNSHMLGVVGLVVLIWLMFRTRSAALGKKKPTFMTRLMNWTFDGLYKTVGQVIPDQKWARRVAPLCITIFFFIVAQYWLGLLPVLMVKDGVAVLASEIVNALCGNAL